MSRLVIDAHVHPQRFTPGFLKEGERFTYNKLENAIMSELPFDNSRTLLADMDRLGIDKACVLTAFAVRGSWGRAGGVESCCSTKATRAT